MKELTILQKQVFDYVVNYLKKEGIPPSRAEIAKGLALPYPSSADTALYGLEKKGYVTLKRGIQRGIIINK